MFNIICILPDSQYTGTVETAEKETEFSYDRVANVYNHAGLLVFPKAAWKRTEDIVLIEPSLPHYPGNETN